MPLIRWCRVALPLEHMPQMSSAIAAQDLRSRHAECAVCMSRHRTRNVIEIRRPATAGLELVGRFVERGIAAGAGVDAVRGCVLVIFAGEGRFGALFAEDAELFCMRC